MTGAFLDRMSEILETPVTGETEFRKTPNWSSLTTFALLVALENDFGARLTLDDLRKYRTIGDLFDILSP